MMGTTGKRKSFSSNDDLSSPAKKRFLKFM